MALYSWSYLKFAAGGEGAILALLNSIVHVVMYTYYLLSGLGPRFQKYLWWKKYVTKMQLIQFILMLAYCAWTHFSPRCQYASGFTYFICTNITIFLFLFLNFYSKSYKKRIEKKVNADSETRNGETKANGVCNGVKRNNENGVNGNCKNVPYLEEIPYEVDAACGDYSKDGSVYLTRRTAKGAFSSEYDFDSIIKK
ncbi:hypothetical protein O3G_MSEX014949 [Manduca sexta]|uniref:Elongation of very long chain fatty acids protein n=1 Tax=Manduca sexta TaxID=7130 RepID=A0A922D0R3_MANSE|nr:hypothetical protein O3G_MSEX014949 [Manduca sexta]